MVIGGVAAVLVWLIGEAVVSLLAPSVGLGPAFASPWSDTALSTTIQASSGSGAGVSFADSAPGAPSSVLADIFGIGGSLVPVMDAAGWLALVGGVGVLGTFAAFGLFLYGVSLVGSVRGSLLGVAEPAGAMIIAAMWLHTPFSAADWAGLVLMAAMLVLVSLSGRSADRRTDTP